MADLVSYLAALLALAVALGRRVSIRPDRPTPEQRHLIIALAALAPGLALAAPTTQTALAHLEPVPYTTQLLSNALAMLAAFSVVVMLHHVIHRTAGPPPGIRVPTVMLVLAALAMAALLATAHVEVHGELVAHAGTHPALIAYHVIFLGYLGSCTVRFILLMRRYLNRPHTDHLLRWGMLGVIAAAVIGLTWMGWTLFVLVLSALDRQPLANPRMVSQALGATAATLVALSSTVPAWGGYLRRTVRRRRVDRALRELSPLWRQLATLLPQITLPDNPLTDPEDRLYRRVIEIRDAQYALQPYVPPDVAGQVMLASVKWRRLDRIAVRTEAASLATAIDAYRAGHRYPTQPTPLTYPDRPDLDPLAEARWLIRVHTALRHDPAVARITHHARKRLDGTPAAP